MKTFKLMFLLTLIASSMMSMAAPNACIMKGKTVAPAKVIKDAQGVEITNPEYITWKNANPAGAIQESWTCCENLKLNPTTRVCQDESLIDDTLIHCKTNAECSNGEGCFPLREDDMFITDSTDPDVINATNEKEEKFNEQMNTLGDIEPKPTTNPPMRCTRDLECESYKCEGNMCVANNICRLADKGEQAVGNIKCMEPYEKEVTTGICTQDQTQFYSLLLGKIEVKPVAGTKQCQFELYPSATTTATTTPEEAREQIARAVNLGVVTTRAMEWLYSSTSMRDDRDCLFTMKHMRDPMKAIAEKRKKILKVFSDKYNLMESDFKKVQDAKQNDMTSILSPCGEFTTAHDIALRRATGLDYLCYMSNRNDMFIEYESAMRELIGEMAEVTKGYDETAKHWDEKAKDWTIGTASHNWEDRKCRSWPKWHKKIKRRWGEKYIVRGKTIDNSIVFNQKMVNDYLGFIGQMDPKSAANEFKKRRYWLIDPLMPGGVNQSVGFDNFGSGGKYDRQLGFLFGSSGGAAVNTDAAKRITSGLLGVHAKFRDRLIDHMKGLNQGSKAAEFIYEPEIPSSFESRGCIDKLNAPECAKFKTYVDTVQDAAFAQFLAYSKHHKRKYKDFFRNEASWRRKLFNRYHTDLANLNTYYESLETLRTSQNACLELVINQLKSSDFNTGDKGINAGTEANNYYNKTDNNMANAKTRATNYNAPKAAKVYANPYAISIGTNGKTFSDNTGKSSLSGDSSAGSTGVSSANSNALAARMKEMEGVNKASIAKNPKLAEKEKEIQDSLKASGLLTGGGAAVGDSSASGADASGTTAGVAAGSTSGTQATIGDKEDTAKSDGSATSGSGSGVAGSGLSSIGAPGSASGELGGIYGGMGSGAESESEAETRQDPTGMSDEEKDVLAANYERQRSSYETKEEDSLFQAVSKTYVRNLDKILTRKKRLEESSPAPAP